MKQEIPLTKERKRKIDAWFNANYGELTRQTQTYLRIHGHHDLDPFEFLSKLYDVLLRKAYGEGWATDEDILKQSKRRLEGFVQDIRSKGRQHESWDQICEDHQDSNSELPDSFVVEPDHEERIDTHMLLNQLARVRDSICKTEYDYDLYEVLLGHVTCQAVADDYGVDRSKVSKDKDLLFQTLREAMLKRGT